MSERGFSTEQCELLGQMLPASAVKQRKQGGGNVSYIEGHHAIREANRIFGFDGWERHTEQMNLVQCEPKSETDKRWQVAYIAKVRVVVRGITREGFGFGNGLNADLGAAHELAVKEAETDAMKRALMTFGDPFGLALYDKSQANVDKGQKPKPREVSLTNGAVAASVAAQAPSEPGAGHAPGGKNAFGYVPVRWPLPKMFQDPMTDSQAKMQASKARERTLPEEDLPTIRHLVLEAYGVEDDGSKGAASLFIDWLINGEEETMDLAVAAAEQANQNETLELE